MIFAVALEGCLLGKMLHVAVGESDGLHGLKAGLRGQLQVGVFAAGKCQQAESKEADAREPGASRASGGNQLS